MYLQQHTVYETQGSLPGYHACFCVWPQSGQHGNVTVCMGSGLMFTMDPRACMVWVPPTTGLCQDFCLLLPGITSALMALLCVHLGSGIRTLWLPCLRGCLRQRPEATSVWCLGTCALAGWVATCHPTLQFHPGSTQVWMTCQFCQPYTT